MADTIHKATIRVYNAAIQEFATVYPLTLAELVALADGTSLQDAIDALQGEVAGNSTVHIVDDIEARDAIEGAKLLDIALVKDATGDETVKAGWAKYILVDDGWMKFAEGESIDIDLNWGAITGGPASAPGDIDAAVNASHEHGNKDVLDGFSEDEDGGLNYDGKAVFQGSPVVFSATEPVEAPNGTIWIQTEAEAEPGVD
jgi:hypothetical protein